MRVLTAESEQRGSDLPSPLRLLHIKVLITKAVVSLPLPISGIDGKLFFFFFQLL